MGTIPSSATRTTTAAAAERGGGLALAPNATSKPAIISYAASTTGAKRSATVATGSAIIRGRLP